MTILNTLLVTQVLNPFSEVGIAIGVLAIVSYSVARVARRLRTLVVKTDSILVELEQGKPIQSLKELWHTE